MAKKLRLVSAGPDDPLFWGGTTIFNPSAIRREEGEVKITTGPIKEPDRPGPPSLLANEKTHQRIMRDFCSSFGPFGDDLSALADIRELWQRHPRLTVDDILYLSEAYLGEASPGLGSLAQPSLDDEDVYDVDAKLEGEEKDDDE